MATALLIGGAAVAVGGAALAGAGGAAVAYHKRKKNQKKKSDREESMARQQVGMYLDELEHLSQDGLPLLIRSCIDCLTEADEGTQQILFLEGGRPERVVELSAAYDDGTQPDLSLEDPLDVADLLVHFLTSLPEPLCTHSLSEEILEAQATEDNECWMEQMRRILMQLPEVNTRVIVYLTRFFAGIYERGSPEQQEAIVKLFSRVYVDTWDGDTEVGVQADTQFLPKVLAEQEVLFEGVDVTYYFEEEEVAKVPHPKDQKKSSSLSRLKKKFSFSK